MKASRAANQPTTFAQVAFDFVAVREGGGEPGVIDMILDSRDL